MSTTQPPPTPPRAARRDALAARIVALMLAPQDARTAAHVAEQIAAYRLLGGQGVR
jgi:hypothetical protein